MSSNPNPVFGGSDRVDGTLPADLAAQIEGKPPAEQQKLIVQYYQKAAQTFKDAAQAAIARAATGNPPPPGTPPPAQPITRATIDATQWQRDPAAAVAALTAGHMTKDEFNAQIGPMAKLAAQVAENLASAGKEHWNKYINEIRQIMAGCTPADQADVSCWNVAYNNVIGTHMREITEAAVTTATTRATEIVQPPAPPLPKPQDLSTIRQVDRPDKTAARVAEGLGIKPETYISSMEKIQKGVFPGLTLDNRERV